MSTLKVSFPLQTRSLNSLPVLTGPGYFSKFLTWAPAPVHFYANTRQDNTDLPDFFSP